MVYNYFDNWVGSQKIIKKEPGLFLADFANYADKNKSKFCDFSAMSARDN